MNTHTKKAFTLIEVLLVIALIAILAAITFIAINPAENFQDARNTTRQSDVTQILNAISQYLGDGNTVADLGTITACDGTPTGFSDIVTATPGTGEVDLQAVLVDEYIVGIPEDPTGASGTDTGYDICVTTANNRVTVAAPSAEGGSTIEVSR